MVEYPSVVLLTALLLLSSQASLIVLVLLRLAAQLSDRSGCIFIL